MPEKKKPQSSEKVQCTVTALKKERAAEDK